MNEKKYLDDLIKHKISEYENLDLLRSHLKKHLMMMNDPKIFYDHDLIEELINKYKK